MKRPLAERFWEKVQKTDTCWLWTGALMSKGYGSMYVGPIRGHTELASRVSWFLHSGVWPEQWVLHHCDTPRCVRPDHLYLGTVIENSRDMVARHRGVMPPQPTLEQHARGSRHGVAKLTEEQVAEIRRRYGPATGRPRKGFPMPKHEVSQEQLAVEYGVDQGTISYIVRGERWQHVS
jgi:hypothetical protein